MVICLQRGADLHMAQLITLPLTVSCFSKIQIGFTFLVLAHLGSPGQRAVKRVCVCMAVSSLLWYNWLNNKNVIRPIKIHAKSSFPEQGDKQDLGGNWRTQIQRENGH